MKKILNLLLLSAIVLLAGCQQANTEVSSSTKPMPSTNDFERPNVEAMEYYDHSFDADGVELYYDEVKWYVNDLNEVPLPDPHVIEVEGTYYIYGTTDRTGARTFDCYSTTDFVTFERHMDVLGGANLTWENGALYAPEVYEFDGKYYMYYSAFNKNDSNKRYLSIVVSDSPTGPFEPIYEENINGDIIDGRNNPVINHYESGSYSVLDSTIFVDDDGQMYMYYVVSGPGGGDCQHIVGVRMIDHLTPDWSTHKKIVIGGEINTLTNNSNLLSWEAYRGYKIAEAPYMIKSPNGKYYMTYSVNSYDDLYYSICYAEADSPLGEFTKPYTKEDKLNGNIWTNLLVGYSGGSSDTSKLYKQWSGFMSGVGHHCFFKAGDQLMIGYHAHTTRKDVSRGRHFAMDYVHFDENGVPHVNGPTWSIQPMPEVVSEYKNIADGAQVIAKNVINEKAVNDNYVVANYNLAGQNEKEVQLGSGKAYIELIFDKEYYVGGLAIYNSAFYEKAIYDIDYINLFSDNVMYNIGFPINYFDDENEFIYPNSAFTVEFDDVKTDRVVICVDTVEGGQINEIVVLGKEVN